MSTPSLQASACCMLFKSVHPKIGMEDFLLKSWQITPYDLLALWHKLRLYSKSDVEMVTKEQLLAIPYNMWGFPDSEWN